MNASKRGQVTLYVIIAIMIVSAAAIIVYTQRETIKTSLNPVPRDIKPIYGQIESCLQSTSENGLYLIGMQGGYTSFPQTAFETDFSFIGYGYYEGQKTLLSIKQLENELDNYIELMFPQCVDFSQWPDLEVTQGDINSKSSVMDNFVVVNVDWPLTFKRETTYQLKTFSARANVRLGRIYNITDTIVGKEIKEPTKIDLSYFSEMYQKENMTINLLPFNDTIVYSIQSGDSMLYNKSYIWFFANKFK
jgi:hypothetical protein